MRYGHASTRRCAKTWKSGSDAWNRIEKGVVFFSIEREMIHFGFLCWEPFRKKREGK